MQNADFLLKMFEKCGFSEENTRELLSSTDAHRLAQKHGVYILLARYAREISTIPTKTDTLGLDS